MPTPLWDVFHSDRLEAERSLTTEAVIEALARRDLVAEDLVRPAGETRWTRLGDSPNFFGSLSLSLPAEEASIADDPPFIPPSIDEDYPFEPPSIDEEEDNDDEAESNLTRFEVDPDSLASIVRQALGHAEDEPLNEFVIEAEPLVEPISIPEPEPEPIRQVSSAPALPVLDDEEAEEPDLPELIEPIPDLDFREFDPQDEDEEAAEFTFTRNSTETVEELDLAAMVDVAFQLVLFFLVTAQVVLYKTLEVPKPNEDKPPEAAAQARTKSIDELEKDYILVEVDAAGTIKIDRQPVPANRATLVEKLRTSREQTSRKAMLLSADFATRHENAVLVFDVANEIDLKIAIAQPTGKK